LNFGHIDQWSGGYFPINTAPGSNKLSSYFSRTFVSIVSYRDFRLFWGGSWSEHLGEWMETTALLWLINEMTHSPLMGTLMVTVRALPMVVFALIGGILADRFNRRILLICALAASAVFSLILAVFVHLGMIQPWHLLLYGGITGITTSFNHPARSTLLPNLVKKEHLLNAITMDNVSVTASRILGATLGGVIIGLAGTTPVLGLRAAGALLAMVWIFMIHPQETPTQAKKNSPLNNLVEGLQYVRKHKDVLTQVLLYLLPIYVMNSYTGLLPYFATEVLHVGPGLYGLLSAASGIGALLVTFYLAGFKDFNLMRRTLLYGGMAQGLGLIALAFSSHYLLALFVLIFIGGAGTVFMTLNNTIIQRLVTDQIRGRVMSLREVAFGLGPSGSLISGAVAGSVGVPLALVIAGILSLTVLVGLKLALPDK
jgi:predicted MFS family arabinose efflux permease